ncbi:MAG: DNA glycosylase [Chlorobiaceae bacterium]
MKRNFIDIKKKINLNDSLFSGQSFLWNKSGNNHDFYCSIIDSNFIFLKQISDSNIEIFTEFDSISSMDLTAFIHHYFTLEIDTENIFPAGFVRDYPELWKLLPGYFPLRILRQDFFETMITFMCAQGIGMGLIRKQVTMLAQNYGEKRTIIFDGTPIDLYSFPSPQKLAAADLWKLSRCTNNNCIRAANISLAARAFAEGNIDPEALRNRQIPLSELRNILCINPGIGYKIADCIALFGLGRFDAFPIDTHVKQYLGQWFNSQTALRSLSPATYLILDAEARSILNPDMAGYAGHMLFHCWRKEIKKLRTF